MSEATSQWLHDRVCSCVKSEVYHNGFDWENFGRYESPPTCSACGLWDRRLHICPYCDEYFYEFFNHPRSGYHPKPLNGWCCWNCLQKYLPPEVQTVWKHRPITPPPAMVLPPGYELVTGVGYR
jgi:hypothetical protein